MFYKTFNLIIPTCGTNCTQSNLTTLSGIRTSCSKSLKYYKSYTTFFEKILCLLVCSMADYFKLNYVYTDRRRGKILT